LKLHKKHTRFLPIAILVLALIGFFALGGAKYLRIEFLAQNFLLLEQWVSNNHKIAFLIFIGVYTLCCAIAIPSVIILSLGAGMFFGGILGGFYSALGATLGGTILYLASNHAVGHHIVENSTGLINKIGQSFKKYEFTNLLGLRLLPIAPFFVVTIAAAVFHVRLRNFVLATFLGILPVETAFAFLGVGVRSKFQNGEVPNIEDFATMNIIAPMLILACLAAVPNLIDIAKKQFQSN
jgi:uncharacterized membrane protein YdjX (TVP38/TMEM64 family)